MLDRAETVGTKSLQLWLTKPIDELAGQPGEDGLDPPATAYAEPFDTYCDMSHLLEAEGYGGESRTRSRVLLRGAARQCRAPRRGGIGSAQRATTSSPDARAIWPGAVQNGTFDWNVLFDPPGPVRTGPARCPVLPREHGGHRPLRDDAGRERRLAPSPGESGFENVVLAGDWTHNGIDGGCVEAAVISGERAAAALIGRDPRAVTARYEPVRRIRRAGDRAWAAALRARAALLLLCRAGSRTRAAAVRPRAEGAHRWRAAIRFLGSRR